MKILSIGVHWHEDENFVTDRELEENDYSFIFFKSPAIALIHGEPHHIEPGMGMLFTSQEHQFYKPSDGTEFLHDFINLKLETPEERSYAEGIPPFEPFVCYSPYQITESIEDVIRETHVSNSKSRWRIVDCLCKIFMCRIRNEIEMQVAGLKKGVHYEKLCRLRDEIYLRPKEDWTVESMSAFVHLSPSYFQTLYKYFFGESCVNDVINARIASAKNMLKYSGMKIGSIAEECGYNNTEHFIRQFGKVTGMSPNKYRTAHK